MNPLQSKVNRFLHELDIRGKSVVAAVSGGADSVAMTRSLALLKEEFDIKRIVIAHVNHHLRGAESQDDEAFVRTFFDGLASQQPSCFEFECLSADTNDEAKSSRQGIEATARRIRYRWFTTIARTHNASFVATGHTANDQAETILFRILRGTGIKGLRGIPMRRHLRTGIDVIRPLLDVSRQEAMAFLNELGQPFREDSSNVNFHFARNRIRHKLLPFLQQRFNPEIVDVLCRLGHQAAESFRDQEEESKTLLRTAELPRAGQTLVFDTMHLQSRSRLQIREMFRRVWERECWGQQQMGYREWDRIAALALGEMTAIDLPGGIRARRHAKVIQIEKTT